MGVSVEARPTRAKATPVSRERFVMPAGYGGAWPGFETTHRATHQRPRPTGVEGAGGTGGPGCGGRGRRRGLAGLRDDAPSGARCADGSRAGRRPRAHKAARPDESGPTAPGTPAAPCCGDGGNRTPVPTRRPEHQGSNKQPSNARTPARHSKRGRHQPTPCASALTHP